MSICKMDFLNIDSCICSDSLVDIKNSKIELQNCHHEEGIY